MFLFVNFGNLGPKKHQFELLEVGHRALYGAMGTFEEGCQNRENNDFSEKMKNKMFYYLKNHDGDSIRPQRIMLGKPGYNAAGNARINGV